MPQYEAGSDGKCFNIRQGVRRCPTNGKSDLLSHDCDIHTHIVFYCVVKSNYSVRLSMVMSYWLGRQCWGRVHNKQRTVCSSWNNCSANVQRSGCTFNELFTQVLQYSRWSQLFKSNDVIQQRYINAIDSMHNLCINIEPGINTRHSVSTHVVICSVVCMSKISDECTTVLLNYNNFFAGPVFIRTQRTTL